MWAWIIGVVVLVVVIAVVMNRRGSTGVSRADDRRGTDDVDRTKGAGYGSGGTF